MACDGEKLGLNSNTERAFSGIVMPPSTYAVPVNCLLIGALSLVLPIGPLTAAMMLDAFLLVMATIGIMSSAAVLVVPNIIIKLLLLFLMLFIGCVSIDTFHTHYFKNSASVIIEIEVTYGGMRDSWPIELAR
uniref:SSD domain-containing protein n=1 Tax=Angiostrongylus cantonensis TaxID=6313 RepID=A0A0K0DNH6_ANGCA